MSQEEQEHPRRPEPGAVRYGDVFAVGGELAGQPIAPQDAAMMQAAETDVLKRARKGGAASVMQSAARRNERLGVVGPDETTDAAAEHGVAVTEASVPGGRVVAEFVADQVGQYIVPDDAGCGGAAATGGGEGGGGAAAVVDGTKITIGEALEATAFSAGDQPVKPSDAAAEARAAGLDEAPPDGLAAQARAAADANAVAERDADKTTLRDVLADVTPRLGADKEVEREDAARVVGAEVRGGAARLNRGRL